MRISDWSSDVCSSDLVVTGVLFLLAMFFTPLTTIVPTEIAGAALVIVGALMMAQIRDVDLSDLSALVPVFLTITVMPLTYSIANGIGAGFISWVLIRSLSGRAREISPPLDRKSTRLNSSH